MKKKTHLGTQPTQALSETCKKSASFDHMPLY